MISAFSAFARFEAYNTALSDIWSPSCGTRILFISMYQHLNLLILSWKHTIIIPYARPFLFGISALSHLLAGTKYSSERFNSNPTLHRLRILLKLRSSM